MAKLGVVEWITNVDKNEDLGWHFDKETDRSLEFGIWIVYVLKNERDYKR